MEQLLDMVNLAQAAHRPVGEFSKGMAQRIGLVKTIDEELELLKVHAPYHESDHVLNITYNVMVGGVRLEDIELRRQDEVFLNAVGAQRIPDPTTAGDFCRRFTAADVQTLQEIINEVRLGVWGRQPAAFFTEAIIDADGTLAETTVTRSTSPIVQRLRR